MHMVAFYFTYTYLLWLKNKEQAVLYTYTLRLSSHIVLSFGYSTLEHIFDILAGQGFI